MATRPQNKLGRRSETIQSLRNCSKVFEKGKLEKTGHFSSPINHNYFTHILIWLNSTWLVSVRIPIKNSTVFLMSDGADKFGRLFNVTFPAHWRTPWKSVLHSIDGELRWSSGKKRCQENPLSTHTTLWICRMPLWSCSFSQKLRWCFPQVVETHKLLYKIKQEWSLTLYSSGFFFGKSMKGSGEAWKSLSHQDLCPVTHPNQDFRCKYLASLGLVLVIGW